MSDPRWAVKKELDDLVEKIVEIKKGKKQDHIDEIIRAGIKVKRYDKLIKKKWNAKWLRDLMEEDFK